MGTQACLRIVTADAISLVLAPFASNPDHPEVDWPHMCGQLALYLDLILKWNARTNLTAIRDPEQIVRRHFGESLFAGSHIGECTTLLDFGSGAGFPGVPIQLLRPRLQVTLAESQGKKAAFLREVCRELGLACEVFAGRVETMPSNRKFDAVALRAVDNMDSAIAEAGRRAAHRVVILTTKDTELIQQIGFATPQQIVVPGTHQGCLTVCSRGSLI